MRTRNCHKISVALSAAVFLLLNAWPGGGATFVFKPGNATLDPGDLTYSGYGANAPSIVPYGDHSSAGANAYSGGMAIYAAAWVGGATSLAWHQVFFNAQQPSSVKVTVEMTYLGGTMNYGFASFSGSSLFWQLDQNRIHEISIDYPFSYDVIKGKIIDLIFLAAGGLLPEGEIADMVEAMDDLNTYASLAQGLLDLVNAGDANTLVKTFEFTVDPGWHSMNVGLMGTASAFVTGSSFALLCGQLEKVTVEVNTRSDLPADLIVSGLLMEETEAARGAYTHLLVERSNVGGQSTWAENYSLMVKDPVTLLYSKIVSNRFDCAEFAPGKTRTDRITYVFTNKGPHELLAWADEPRLVIENEDFNNSRSRIIYVRGSPPDQPEIPKVAGYALPYGIQIRRNEPQTITTSSSDRDHETIYYWFETHPAGATEWQALTNLATTLTNGWNASSNIVITPVLADPDLLPGTNIDARTHFVLSTNKYYFRVKAADSDGESAFSLTNAFTIIMNDLPQTPVVTGPTGGTTLSGASVTATTSDRQGDLVAFRFDWGDNPTPTWTDWYWCPKGQTNLTVFHLYSKAGLYCVNVEATDAYSSRYDSPVKTSAPGSHWIQIRNYVPATNALVVASVDAGTLGSLPNVVFAVSGSTVVGPTNFFGITGSDGTFETPAMPGTYVTTFSNVAGYTTPAPQTLTLPTNGAIQFRGLYAHLTASIQVYCNIDGHGKIYGYGTATGNNHDFAGAWWVTPAAWEGEHTIIYDPVDELTYGLPVPRQETKALSSTNSIVFRGRYIKRPVPSLTFTYPTNAAAYLPPNSFALVDEDIVSFDATASYSPAQPRGPGPPYAFPELTLTNALYRFSFDEGRVYSEDATVHGDGAFDGKTLHIFHQAGARQVALTVWDSAGCPNVIPATVSVRVKQRPVALPAVVPSPAIAGETVLLSGQGRDADPGDTIAGYEWALGTTGVFSTAQTLLTNQLPVGMNDISLRVQGSDNVWSKPAPAPLEVVRAREWPAFKKDQSRVSAQPTYKDRSSGQLPYGFAGGFWPFTADSAIEGSPVAANLDGDWVNGLGIVFVSRNGTLAVVRNNSVLLWTNNVGASSSTPAIGDINGDGWPEIVVGSQTGVWAFDRNGTNLYHYVSTCGFQYSMPVIADIDPAVPGREVAITGDDGTVHLIYADGTAGTNHWPFSYGGPVPLAPMFSSAPAVADIDGGHNGLEVVVGGTDGTLYVLDCTGSVLASNAIPGRPQIHTTPAIADLCPELPGSKIVFGADDGVCRCFNYQAGLLVPMWQYTSSPPAMIRSSPAVGVAGETHEAQVAFGCDNGHVYLLLGTNGACLGDYNCGPGVMVRSTPAFANIDSIHNLHPLMGDLAEVIVGASDGNLHAISFAFGGSPVPGWPILVAPNQPVFSSPAVADIDHDPDLEILVGANDKNLYLLKATPNPALAPVAAFNAVPRSGSRPLSVSFTDTSNNSPSFWTWDFGDGSGSSQQNPVHAYSNPGTYSVTLSVANAHGTSSVTQTNHITVNPVPLANFAADIQAGPVPLTVQFTDQSLFGPDWWFWNFGDGGASLGQNPSHTYTQPGVYSVMLDVTNAAGHDLAVRTNYIVAQAVSPVAAFTNDVAYGCQPLTVHFTDQSLHSPTAWLWQFGDGATSGLQNPSHTYTAAGAYLVSLIVSNAAGSDAGVSPAYILVLTNAGASSQPLAWLSFDEGSGSTAHDATSNHNDGTLNGVSWTPGHDGTGLLFQGNLGAVIVPHSSSLDITNAFSIEAWIKVTGSDHYLAIADKRGGEASARGFTFYLTGGCVRLSLYGDGDRNMDCIGLTDLRDNAWHYV